MTQQEQAGTDSVWLYTFPHLKVGFLKLYDSALQKWKIFLKNQSFLHTLDWEVSKCGLDFISFMELGMHLELYTRLDKEYLIMLAGSLATTLWILSGLGSNL